MDDKKMIARAMLRQLQHTEYDKDNLAGAKNRGGFAKMENFRPISASIFNIRSLRPLLAGSLMLAGVCFADTAGSINYGINYDVVSTDGNLIAKCEADPDATVHQKFVVPRYSSPLMQKAVRQDLAR